ncbi:enolase, partial [Tanacetum coccineum]
GRVSVEVSKKRLDHEEAVDNVGLLLRGIELLTDAVISSLVDDNADHVKDLSLLKEHVKPKAHSCDNFGIKEAIVTRESDNWNDMKDKSVAPSKELRLHWDLNTMMDEWVEPCDDLVAEQDPHDSCIVYTEISRYYSTPVASSSLFDDDDNYDEDEEEEPRKELQTTSLPGRPATPYDGQEVTFDPKSHPQLHILLIKVVVRDLVDNESNLKGEPQSIWLHQLKGQMTSILYMLIMHIIDMKTFILSRSQLGLRTIRLRPHYGEIHSWKMNVHPDVNFEELARSTDDFNGAQLKVVCVEAGMLTLRHDATEAVDKVNSIIAPTLFGKDPTEHTKIDNFMVQELDGTVNEWVGATRSFQICCLYMQHIANFAGNKTLVLPVPAFNVINRGSHAGNKLAMQEFVILPVGASYFRWVLPYSMKDIQYDNAKFKKC